MKDFVLRAAGAAILAGSVAFGGAASAQDRVAANTDWVVNNDEATKECWVWSLPKEKVATRDGKPAEVKRGDVVLFVTYRPGQGGELSFSSGYPFAEGSRVELEVGGKKFGMFTQGEGAWADTPQDDAKIIAAMKAGSEATLSGRSGRGTQTKDKFSLSGFTAATTEAANRCK